MAQSNWSAEPGNATRDSDRAARQVKARRMDLAARAAGRGRRRV
jgi:hypothetical protein